MTISFDELCETIALAKSLQPDFWKHNQLYIQVGTYPDRRVSNTEPFPVNNSPDIAVDLNAKGEALGIEFLPV